MQKFPSGGQGPLHFAACWPPLDRYEKLGCMRTSLLVLSVPRTAGAWLQTTVALAGILLVAVTTQLWFGGAGFPQVPLFGWAAGASSGWDMIASVVLCLSLVVGGAAQFTGQDRLARSAWAAFVAAAALSVILDQHRWQPWLWQFALFATIFAIAPARDVSRLARIVVISLYIHSAVGKLDRSFLQTHGPLLVDGLLANFGTALPARGAIRMWSAAALPAGEFLVGLLLSLRPTRRFGVRVSWMMHGGLMLALGPWGLDHRPGVLIWNAFFLVQNALIFREDRGGHEGTVDQAMLLPGQSLNRRSPGQSACFLLCGIVALVPVLEPFDLLDPWLGWGLYSSRGARLRMFVEESAVGRLPSDLQPFVEPAPPLESWRRVRLDRWSLATTGAPISPQLRFQAGVALDVSRSAKLGDSVRLQIESPADRWTARRESHLITGVDAIETYAAGFRLNAEPRRNPSRQPD